MYLCASSGSRLRCGERASGFLWCCFGITAPDLCRSRLPPGAVGDISEEGKTRPLILLLSSQISPKKVRSSESPSRKVKPSFFLSFAPSSSAYSKHTHTHTHTDTHTQTCTLFTAVILTLSLCVSLFLSLSLSVSLSLTLPLLSLTLIHHHFNVFLFISILSCISLSPSLFFTVNKEETNQTGIIMSRCFHW